MNSLISKPLVRDHLTISLAANCNEISLTTLEKEDEIQAGQSKIKLWSDAPTAGRMCGELYLLLQLVNIISEILAFQVGL
jgi:hypothetical protein